MPFARGLAEVAGMDSTTTPSAGEHPGAELPRAEGRAPRRGARSEYDGLALYLAEIGRIPRLSRGEEAELARKAREGDAEARRALIEGSLRLVVGLARPYARDRVPLLDLIAEGNTGLVRAAESFDPVQGCRFATYAAWWIRRRIRDALREQAHGVRIPEHAFELFRQVLRCRERFRGETGREPAAEEVAAELATSPATVRVLLEWSKPPVSLNEAWGDEERQSWSEVIADPRAADPRDRAESTGCQESLQEAFGALSPLERSVVERRFGLADGVPRSRADLGREFGVTREAIRQMELRALKKLRHPARARHLREPLP